MKPYKTKPVFAERIWGGNKLRKYNKNTGESVIGESWETGAIDESVPLLIKLIDARDSLSVQVHPDDELALRLENARNGKNEAWVILECEKDSFIICGFNRTVKKEELVSMISNRSITEALNFVEVKKGDYVYIPAGTVHSLGKGILAYEVQQPSDLTYRLYDWDRTDSLGNSRELHIDKAIEAINYDLEQPCIKNIYDSLSGGFANIINSGYFQLDFRQLKHKERQSYEPGRFRAVTTVYGSVVLKFEDSLILSHKGDTCIIPENYCSIVNIEGLEDAEYIVATNRT